MKIFLLWRCINDLGQVLAPERVASNLQKIFSPLFSTPPKERILQNSAMSVVVLEMLVLGWKPPFFQEDRQTWALALDYPINARTVLAENGISFENDSVLPILCRKLQHEPTVLLREMAPPFSLVWASKQTDQTFVQNDGLGQSQLFELKGDRLWALTNKITALKALDVPLEMEREHWAVRSTLGWFPLDLTGYKKVRFLQPATQLRLDSTGITRTAHDVLSDWVHPNGLSQNDCLELARSSLLKQIKAAMPLWEKPSVGLSGGWDSRAVVTSLRAAGADFSARVRGLPGRDDVLIASELAKIAGFNLRVKKFEGLPPDDAEACKRCISLALLWQAGHMVTHKHKTFLSHHQYLDGGVVNIMGQHGEIGRGYYAQRIRAVELSEDQYEERLLTKLMASMPPFTRKELHDVVRQIIREAYRQADRYSLTGLARLDFFYLYERTRRWASGSLSSQTGLVFAPFLNPDFIRAVFDYIGYGKETNPFHRYIIATNSPDWVTVPYSEDLKQRELTSEKVDVVKELERKTVISASWKRPKGGYNYDSSLYWKAVGEPIIHEALARGGFWTEIFDPDMAEKWWQAAPDDLAIVHLLPEMLRSY